MCNCIQEVEKRLAERLTETRQYSELKIKSVSLDNIAIMFSGGTQMVGSATIRHEPRGRKSEAKVNICYKYCPFCGERYDNPELGGDSND